MAHFIPSPEGEFGDEYLSTMIDFQVKVGAQIMMLNNNADGRWVNGSIGKVTDITGDDNSGYIIVAELVGAEIVEITPHTRAIFRFFAEGGGRKSLAGSSNTR